MLAHASNLCRLTALAQSDLLLLQAIMSIASATNALYNILQPKPLLTPAGYGTLFAVFSALLAAKIYRERDVRLSNVEERVYAEYFGGALERGKFAKLAALGLLGKAGGSEETVIRHGESKLVLVVQGGAWVCDGEHRMERGPGFLGKVAFLLSSPFAYDCVRVKPHTTYISWEHAELAPLLEAEPAVRRALEGAIGSYTARKYADLVFNVQEWMRALDEAFGRASYRESALNLLLRETIRGGDVAAWLRQLHAYRAEHGVPRKTHEVALKECGIDAMCSGSSNGGAEELRQYVKANLRQPCPRATPHCVKDELWQELLPPGTEVHHVVHGRGEVTRELRDGRRVVLFSSGEEHCYERGRFRGELTREPAAPAEVKLAFERFDTDASGFIELSEMRPALAELGAGEADDEVVLRVLSEFDRSNDGRLSLSEFHCMFLAIQNMQLQARLAEYEALGQSPR